MKLKWLKDKAKEKFYPITHIDAVVGLSELLSGNALMDQSKQTVFNDDGSITQTTENQTTTTTFNPDGSITETITIGGVTKTKTTVFNTDGSITETIS